MDRVGHQLKGESDKGPLQSILMSWDAAVKREGG